MKKVQHILFIAGELSGDMHGSSVAYQMKKKNPHLDIKAIGGPHFKNIGVPLLAHINDLSVVGIIEVVSKYKKMVSILKNIANYIVENKPDMVIFIDFPGFNLKLASMVQGLGIKLIFYISPQIWAWHYSRIKKIRNLFDEVIVLLPFEKEIYEKENIPVQYLGHPLAYKIKNYRMQKKFKKRNRKLVLFLPGSRMNEVFALLPVMNQIIEKWNDPKLDFYFVCADSIDKKWLYSHIIHRKNVKIEKSHTYDLMKQADLVITASGTASLESSLFLKPTIVLYKVHFLSKLLFNLFVTVKYISLTNILLQRKVIPEFFNFTLDADKILKKSQSLLRNDKDIVKQLKTLYKTLYSGNSYERTGKYLLGLLRN